MTSSFSGNESGKSFRFLGLSFHDGEEFGVLGLLEIEAQVRLAYVFVRTVAGEDLSDRIGRTSRLKSRERRISRWAGSAGGEVLVCSASEAEPTIGVSRRSVKSQTRLSRSWIGEEKTERGREVMG